MFKNKNSFQVLILKKEKFDFTSPSFEISLCLFIIILIPIVGVKPRLKNKEKLN